MRLGLVWYMQVLGASRAYTDILVYNIMLSNIYNVNLKNMLVANDSINMDCQTKYREPMAE